MKQGLLVLKENNLAPVTEGELQKAEMVGSKLKNTTLSPEEIRAEIEELRAIYARHMEHIAQKYKGDRTWYMTLSERQRKVLHKIMSPEVQGQIEKYYGPEGGGAVTLPAGSEWSPE